MGFLVLKRHFDDFGSKYSNYEYFLHLNIDIIKNINIAKNLGILVITEFVDKKIWKKSKSLA